jgi:putative two-component system response regulator
MRATPIILTVDDNPDDLFVLSEILEEQFGFKMVKTEKADEVMPLTLEHNPDLILLDIMMEGTDGLTLCRELKANPKTRNIPVIFITAKDDFSDMLQGLDAGAEDYLKKPYSALELYARCKTNLRVKARFDDILEKKQALEEEVARLREQMKKQSK